jgi:hypothetical protein
VTSPGWTQVALLKGPKGDPGGSGPAGRGVQAATINPAGQLVVAYTDGTSQNLGIVVGPPGQDGRSVTIAGQVADASALPTLGSSDGGTGILTENDGHLWVWSGAPPWVDVGPVRGPKGDPGDPGPQGARGTVWFNGDGVPGSVPGSQFGDYYLDRLSGIAYQLTGS